MKFRHFISSAALAMAAIGFAPAEASAATFTANLGVGSSNVGPGGDYPDLASAAEDFTTGSQAVTGNYTFFITGSTTETRQMAFGKATNGFTITIKPAPATTATITFAYGTQNNNASTFGQTQGCPGQIIVGLNNLANTNAAIEGGFVPTNNFVVDGSNTNGGTTRDLTLQTPNAGLINSRTVHILGSNNCVVKNCNITNGAQGSPSVGVFVTTVKLPISSTGAPTTVASPLNTVIDNNLISASGNGSAAGILFNAFYDGQLNTTNFPAAGSGAAGYVISNNTVVGRNRGIALSLGLSGTITSNTVSAGNSSSAYSGVGTSGIAHINSFNSTGWTIDITKNWITSLAGTNTGSGLGAIALGVAAQGAGTYNVSNNMMAGFTNGAGNNHHHGIFCRANASDYNLRHNSINVSNTSATAATADFVAAILIESTARTGISRVHNNLVRLAQDNGIGISHVTNDTTKLITDGNDIALVGATTNFGRFGGTNAATLAAWKLATNNQEALGQTVDPAATTGSKWVSADAIDLHFVPIHTVPVGISGGVPVATTGIATDIDGQPRSASAPLPGADEVIAGTGVLEWQLF